MITFLPVADFDASARMLDTRRLGNQRVEARMILRWLRNPLRYARQQAAGYTAMWRGHEDALAAYYNACCEEWARRGKANIECTPEALPAGGVALPPWLGDERLHATHRAALMFKEPDHYAQFGWNDEPQVAYLWPRPVERKEAGAGEAVGANEDAHSYTLEPPKSKARKARQVAPVPPAAPAAPDAPNTPGAPRDGTAPAAKRPRRASRQREVQ